MDDLFQALQMFQSGARELSMGRAIANANEAVQQVKQSEANEQEQRAQLHAISNDLVSRLAAGGVPATTIQQVAGAVGPKSYANSNAMASEAVSAQDPTLMQQAQQLQAFEQNPEYKKQLIAAKAANANPLAQAKFEEQQREFTTRQLGKYKDDLDAAKSTSRSVFGQWAATNARGDRLESVLGNPERWNNLTEQELSLVNEGLIQMSKGGVGTKEESEAMKPFMAKIAAARAQTAATGQPVALDLSGFAKLASGVIQREGDASKDAMLDIILNKAHGSTHISALPGAEDQFKKTTAAALQQAGITVDPASIRVGKKGVEIPGVTDVIDRANSSAPQVRKMMADFNSGDPAKRAAAEPVMKRFGITPEMSTKDAVERVRKAIRSRVFQ